MIRVGTLPRLRLLLALFLAPLAVGCDDPPPKVGGGGAPARPVRRRLPAKKKPAEKKIKTLELSEADFLESPANRDPFRSYLADFLAPGQRAAVIQRNVKLQRYGLDELRLVAVVTGQTRARAMFRDPTGLGVAVKRGDFISKSGGRVKQILPGKVVVEIQEQFEGAQRVSDRVIELHPQSGAGGGRRGGAASSGGGSSVSAPRNVPRSVPRGGSMGGGPRMGGRR